MMFLSTLALGMLLWALALAQRSHVSAEILDGKLCGQDFWYLLLYIRNCSGYNGQERTICLES
jgi:hypothetical protein